MKKNEIKRGLFSLRLTTEQSDLAERLAREAHRSQQGFFIWLLESYSKGELTQEAGMDRLEKKMDDLTLKIDRVAQEKALLERLVDRLSGQGTVKSLRGGKGPADLRERPGESPEQDSTTRLNPHSKQTRRQSE